MTWQYNTDRERYMRLLREYREQEIPDWDDMDRGILVALVQERPTIWNSGAKFYKDDVMASFQQVTEVLQRKMVNLNVWAVVEKWCWMVEIYIRCTNSSPKRDWRYNSSLAFLEPFNTVKYPYLGSLTMERVLQLTDKFEQKDWLSSEEADKFTFKFPVGLFWDEIGDGAANLPAANFTRAQVARRRKRNLKSNSPQITKTSPKPTPPPQEVEEEDVKLFDEHGFSHAMYLELIELVKTEAAELWHNTHPRRNDTVSHDVAYASVARQIRSGGPRGDALSGKDVEMVWRELAERFYAEEAAADGAKSDWKYFEKLQFLSHRVMPAFLYDSIYLKNNDPSTSQEMTSTSPSPQQQQVSHKSIQAVLDSILLKNQKSHLHLQQQNMMMGSSQENEIIMSELQKILNNGHVLMSEPPVKKSRRSQSPVEKNQETTTVVVVNDARNCTPTTISTWVPPKEEISSASTSTILTPKEEIIEKPPATKKPSLSSSTVPTTSTTVPPSTTVTAVIRQHASNSQHEKQLRKLTAVQNQQNQHSKLITLQNPAIAHALLNKPANMSNGVIGANNMSNGNSNMSNGQTAKIVVEQEDKWVLLGKLIATSCREIEQRDAILAVHLNKEILEILHKFQIKSLGG